MIILILNEQGNKQINPRTKRRDPQVLLSYQGFISCDVLSSGDGAVRFLEILHSQLLRYDKNFRALIFFPFSSTLSGLHSAISASVCSQ